MKKINILILVDKFDYHGSYINGPTRNYSWLLKRLDPKRFNVHLYVLREKGKSCEIFKRQDIPITHLDLHKFNPFTLFVVVQIIWCKKIDILHLQGYGSVFNGLIAGTICRRPVIVKEEWVDPNISKFQCLLERILNSLATRAIAISEYASKFLTEKKGIKKDKIVLISNGIPLDEYRNTAKEVDRLKRRKFGISDDDTVVGIVGMLHPNKGHRYFIDAAYLVLRQKPKTKFMIIGDGVLRSELEQQVTKLGLENHVIFTGHQNDMPKMLQMIDIFVMASISETWGTSLVEAMAARKPIVTSDSGGPSEIIRDGWTGLIVPAKDPEAIAEKIICLIDNPTQRLFLSENSQRESEKYNINHTVQHMQNLYEEIFIQYRNARSETTRIPSVRNL